MGKNRFKMLFFFFTVTASCILNAQTDCRDSLLKDFIIGKEKCTFQKYYSKRKIPQIVFTKIKEISKEKFSLCNPNRKFQSTDLVVNPFLKLRQLQFIERSDKYIVIVYKRGGKGAHTITMICDIETNGFCITGLDLGKVQGIDEIYEKLKKGGYTYSTVW